MDPAAAAETYQNLLAERLNEGSDELALRACAADGNQQAARFADVLRALDARIAIGRDVLDQ